MRLFDLSVSSLSGRGDIGCEDIEEESELVVDIIETGGDVEVMMWNRRIRYEMMMR